MAFSDFFHPECDPVEPYDAQNHVVFSCLQWKKPSLEVMPEIAKQTFAIMYGDEMNQSITAALERAYILGAMSPIKLIAVHEKHIHLFLDDSVSSATLPEVQSMWEEVAFISSARIEVDFAHVSEVYSGRSDYIFWQDAKEILESYSLGIENYEVLTIDDFADEPIDKVQWLYSVNEAVRHPQSNQICPNVAQLALASMVGHSECHMVQYYLHPRFQKPDE